MPRKSKIISALKEEEIKRFRKMKPIERINLAITHNDIIRSIFGAGLRLKGFSEKQINEIWKKNYEVSGCTLDIEDAKNILKVMKEKLDMDYIKSFCKEKKLELPSF